MGVPPTTRPDQSAGARAAPEHARTGAEQAREGRSKVTVLTINVKAFQLSDGGGKADDRAFDAIERYIERVDPDVVLFQELDRGTTRSGGVDQLAEIARRVDATDSQFGKAIPHQGGDYGVGVLTRNGHRIEDDESGRNRAEVVQLPRFSGPGADPEQRVALVAAISTPRGDRFSAVSTHLSSRGPGRGAQVERIDDIVSDLRGGAGNRDAGLDDDLPDTVVVGGDFNARRDAVEAHLADHLRHVGAIDRKLGDTGIDHIYVTDGVDVVDSRLDEAEVVEDHWLPFGLGRNVRSTDHPAVQATLLLP